MAEINDNRPSGNEETSTQEQKEGPSMLVLFVWILLVSIGLALWTDWHIVVRGLVAVVTGIAAAAVTYVISNRSSQGVDS